MSKGPLPAILVVDDTPANLQVTRRLLRNVECEVVEAADGNDALTRFLEREYALILLDVHMPVMDGYEVAHLMRADVDSPRTPIIFVTAAYNDDLHRERGYETGAVDYLSKPIEPAILLAKVRVFLELYQAKHELQEIKQNLERVVEKRTAELRDSLQVADRLRVSAEKALERAQKASEVRARFLSRVSHELRTPMNGILGLLQLMDRESLSESQQEGLRGIESSANNLLVTLNEVLDFTQITTGGLTPQLTRLALDDLLGEVADVIKKMAQEKHLDFEVELEGCKNLSVLADGDLLRRILLAFGQNSVKFSQSGTIRLRALCELHDASVSVRIGVQDEGIGISPEQQTQIFEGFSQADESSTRSTGGVGLGLAVAQELAHVMGAQLQLESEPGVGSTFWLEGTLERAEAANEAKQGDRQDRRKNDAPGTGGRLRVLVAEDNKVNQQVACGMLRKIGIEFEVANDGLEAVEKFRPGAFAMILMDLDMPRMDGFEATRAIRALEKREGGDAMTRIIALTANLAGETRQRCLEAGMDDYLGKPVRLQQLRDMIENYQALQDC